MDSLVLYEQTLMLTVSFPKSHDLESGVLGKNLIDGTEDFYALCFSERKNNYIII